MENNSLLNQDTRLYHEKYQIKRYLSSGGFGNTYEAIDTTFSERVAIKELFVQGMCDRDSNNTVTTLDANKDSFDSLLQKFKKEALRLRKIDHQNIVKVRDFFEENDTAYYVMDFVEGASLASVIKASGKPLAEDKALDIFNKVLSALDCIHNNNIWHLDIKPGNIMINKDFNPILIDFGASKQLKDATGNAMSTSSSLVLTPGFAPAEQMEQNFDKFGPWTDFYALGATLYFCLTLRVPPMPSDIAENGAASLNMPKPISDKTQQLITWLLEPNRNKRPQNVAEINQWMNGASAKTVNDSLETVVAEKRKVQDIDTNSKAPKKFSKKYLLLIPLLIVIAGSAIGYYMYQPKHWLSEADAYYYGEGRAVDKTKAAELYAKAVERGNAEAMLKLGRLYKLENNGVKQDFKKAIELFKMSAEKGNSDAMFETSDQYYEAYVIDYSERDVYEWAKKSADKNNPLGQLKLGLCCKKGVHVVKNNSKGDSLVSIGFKNLLKCANNFNPEYWTWLSICYSDGVGTKIDNNKAFYWATKSAYQGQPEAENVLGYYYENGIGCRSNPDIAYEWYLKSANQGNLYGINNVGACYEFGTGVTKDLKKAFKYYLRAAKLGLVLAETNVGGFYYEGKGVSQNYTEAKSWFLKALKHNNDDAKVYLGIMYQNGYGVDIDYTKACKYLKSAAEQNNSIAQYDLGNTFENGYGVKKDIKLAKYWYRKAADNGDEDAKAALKRLGI